MTETALEFGPERRCVGILCTPEANDPPRRAIAVLITNSGIIHHVGANRLHVRLARFLAAHGYASLRYDLPGIGESEFAGGDRDPSAAQLAGTCAAIDTLHAMGVAEHFVILGLCSGAGHSVLAAVAHPRVTGAVLIDPPVMLATRRHRFNQLVDAARRGLRPRVWWRLARGSYDLRSMLRHRSIEPNRPGMPVSVPNSQDQDHRRQTAAALQVLVDRRVRLWMVVTGHNREIFSYRGQFFDAFPEIPALRSLTRVDLRPSAGHTFGAEADRRFLETCLVQWLDTTAFVSTGEPRSHGPIPAPDPTSREGMAAR